MILPLLGLVAAAWILMPSTSDTSAAAGDDDGPPAPAVGWSTKPGVVLNDALRAFADALHQRSGVPFVITSGVRTPEAQASAMLTKIELGADLYGTYKDSLRDFITAIYEAAPDLEAMAAVVRDFLARGIVPSRHLLGDALDIRIKDQPPANVAALDQAGRELGAETLQEGQPPCLHMQRIPFLLNF